ncbi:MAG: nitrogen regulation protein NR(II) [Pseudomonadota bacterium]
MTSISQYDNSGLSRTPLVDALHTSVLVLDQTNGILKLNNACERLFGRSAKQVVGKPLASLLIDTAAMTDLANKTRSDNKSFSLRTLELDLGPGRSVILDCHASPSLFNRHPCVVLELHDVTEHERIQREAELIKQHGVSRTIVKQLAHEIKNPLGGIRGSAQLLARRLQQPANQKYIEVIISEVDRLAKLVDSMLGPGNPLLLKSTNIHQVLDRALELIASEMGGRVSLLRNYDPSLPELDLDSDQMLQVVLNLLRNACQALDAQGEITIRTRAEFVAKPGMDRNRLYATIEIQDNGPGIPEELGNQIFFPLVSGRAGGTGIGLALVQEIVERHKGTVDYRSRPGETVFTILLPMRRDNS